MRIPKLCKRKDRNLAYISIGREKIYFGKWGEPETAEAYSKFVDDLIHGRTLGDQKRVVTIKELAEKFLESHKDYYVSNGKQTRQLARFQTALDFVLQFYADLPVDEFGPLKLQSVRRLMIESDRFARDYLNTLVNCIRQVFKYGVEQELVLPETLQGLKAVSPIKRGRSTLREVDPVKPVDAETVDKTIQYLSTPLAAMVQLQRLTGMRPGEVCIMRASDLHRDGELLIYTLSHDKTDYRRSVGDLRTIPLGRRAQDVLAPFLAVKTGDDYLFSPLDAELERYDVGTRRFNPHYDVDAYRRAIDRASKKAKAPKWSPNQLRHLYATEIRSKYGLEAAQIMLGHSNANVTQIYAERDRARAIEIATIEG